MKNKHNKHFYLNKDVKFIIVLYFILIALSECIGINMQIHNKCKLIFNKTIEIQDFNCDLFLSNVTDYYDEFLI